MYLVEYLTEATYILTKNISITSVFEETFRKFSDLFFWKSICEQLLLQFDQFESMLDTVKGNIL